MAGRQGNGKTYRRSIIGPDDVERSRHTDFSDLSIEDQQTLNLVTKVKETLPKNRKDNEPITESDVEFATYDARCDLKLYDRKFNNYKETSVDNERSKDLFEISAAYAMTPDEVDSILGTKKNQFNNNPDLYPRRKPVSISFGKTIDPFKSSCSKTCDRLDDLFNAVHQIKKKDILRADRMFYAEAKRLVNNLNDYTTENAHDQVQAIRLMHFEPKPDDELEKFIRDCKTFESAYSYLQKLVKRQIKSSKSPSSSPAHSHESSGANSALCKSSHTTSPPNRRSMSGQNDRRNDNNGKNNSHRDNQHSGKR